MIDPTTRCPSRVFLMTGVLVLLLIGAVPAVLALADCPAGCSCMLPADAKRYDYGYCGGKQQICGYDRTQQAMYCYATPTATSCPSGCECLSDAAAKSRFGSYVKCSESACGFEPTAVAMIPRYCVKKAPDIPVTSQTTTLVPAPVCPAGCECIPEAQAQQQPNTYMRCSETPCSQLVTGSALIKNYCYKKTQTTVCPQGCTCMPEAKAKEAYGTYERCSDTLCSSAPNTATAAGAAPAPEYCFRQKVAPSVCPQGCDCITPDDAKAKYGVIPDRCSSDICGYYQPVTAANAAVAKYCFRKPAGTTPAPEVCPSGCSCMAVEDAKKLEYSVNYCNNVQTSCGYDNLQRPLFCFGPYTPAQPTCVYDTEKNTCAGSCSEGYSCGLVYAKKDDAGKVTEGACRCIPPPVSSCVYDTAKNTCAGTCPNGGQCTQVGLSQNVGAAPVPQCGCPNAVCYFDYAKDNCAGTCPGSNGACQLNTMYRNAVTGKTEYADCHCKGKPAGGGTSETATPPAGSSCTCDPSKGCTGSCPEGLTCYMTETTTDALGKISCSACNCKEICRLAPDGTCTGGCPDGSPCVLQTYTDPASGASKSGCGCGGAAPAGAAAPAKAPAPDVFTAIGNFFKSLFGWK